MAKTIVFCATEDAAERMRVALTNCNADMIAKNPDYVVRITGSDDYGKSKSLGECISEAMVLRTSSIGEEIHKNASLIAWAKSQQGKTMGGFTTHLWNGITTNEYANICGDCYIEVK